MTNAPPDVDSLSSLERLKREVPQSRPIAVIQRNRHVRSPLGPRGCANAHIDNDRRPLFQARFKRDLAVRPLHPGPPSLRLIEGLREHEPKRTANIVRQLDTAVSDISRGEQHSLGKLRMTRRNHRLGLGEANLLDEINRNIRPRTRLEIGSN
ncbi:hypothetical protein D3C80_652070 [compost metagenome]